MKARATTQQATPKSGNLSRHFSATQPDPVAQTLASLMKPCPPAKVHRAPDAGPVFRVRSIDGTWAVFDRAWTRVTAHPETLSDAVILAKDLARREGSAQIIVYGSGGEIVSEFFYESEQRPALASDTSVRSFAASRPRRPTVRVARKARS